MFEQTFKNIDDILFKDSGADSELDYIGQTSWIMFLRYLDELELSDVKQVFFTNKIDELYCYLSDYFDVNVAIPNVRERENKIKKDVISENDLQFACKFLREEIQIFKKFGGVG